MTKSNCTMSIFKTMRDIKAIETCRKVLNVSIMEHWSDGVIALGVLTRHFVYA